LVAQVNCGQTASRLIEVPLAMALIRPRVTTVWHYGVLEVGSSASILLS